MQACVQHEKSSTSDVFESGIDNSKMRQNKNTIVCSKFKLEYGGSTVQNVKNRKMAEVVFQG